MSTDFKQKYNESNKSHNSELVVPAITAIADK